MRAGETVVLEDDAEGIAAGKEGSRVQSHTGTNVVALTERQGGKNGGSQTVDSCPAVGCGSMA